MVHPGAGNYGMLHPHQESEESQTGPQQQMQASGAEQLRMMQALVLKKKAQGQGQVEDHDPQQPSQDWLRQQWELSLENYGWDV